MKKGLFIFAAMLIALLAQAKEYVFVIRGHANTNTGSTVVTSDEGSQIDTLNVVPAVDVTSIYITLKDLKGNTIESYYSPAQCNDHFSIITPVLPNGYVLEVSDERGVVFVRYEN